jgi:hypothetical protein
MDITRRNTIPLSSDSTRLRGWNQDSGTARFRVAQRFSAAIKLPPRRIKKNKAEQNGQQRLKNFHSLFVTSDLAHLIKVAPSWSRQ